MANALDTWTIALREQVNCKEELSIVAGRVFQSDCSKQIIIIIYAQGTKNVQLSHLDCQYTIHLWNAGGRYCTSVCMCYSSTQLVAPCV